MAALTSLWNYLRYLCPHRHVSLPMQHRQRCLDCGRFRFYEWGGPRSGWLREICRVGGIVWP